MLSAFSSALIRTYKELGFMAPIPKDMATWSPHLFKLLTESFFEEEVFKKSTSDTSYTCSNIPVLVAVLVHLEDKGIICCGNTLTKEVKPLFHSAGLYQDTRHWLEDGWPDLTDGITETWANTLQTTYSGLKRLPRSVEKVACVQQLGNHDSLMTAPRQPL
jgi:hypothetical protein